ncbi:MAG: ferritin-like domain-containing protein [Candidatus Omnitrophica bacterium]|nr:ferritin-like domain-containing protein [Candidatus Omnitrophota bacterium]
MPDVQYKIPTQRDSGDWLEYFQTNNATLLAIPWEAGAELSPADKQAIAASVQIFQLGERSEGKHLAKSARQYAQQTGDQAYYEAMVLFIKEEQRHARDLGRFMELNGIPIIKRTPTDSVFRWLRHLADLEVSVAVLVCAEILAQVYYPALQQATRSRILIRLCEQIIADEDDHVTFQSQRLAILRRHRPGWMIPVIHALYRGFFWTTTAVVWFGHRSVFRAAGQTFLSYVRDCGRKLNTAIAYMDPKRLEI